MCCLEIHLYVICDEAQRGQDSEGGCEEGYESWKQSKIGSDDDRFGYLDVEVCAQTQRPDWNVNEGIKGYILHVRRYVLYNGCIKTDEVERGDAHHWQAVWVK